MRYLDMKNMPLEFVKMQKTPKTPLIITLLTLLFLTTSMVRGEEMVDLTTQKAPYQDEGKLRRVKELGGEVLIDGSLRVLEPGYFKVFDMVETSTPVVAGSNHARLFLRADGTKQSLVIGWDDGTYTRITGN